MLTIEAATQLSSGEVLSAVARLADEGRQRTADLIALLCAVDERELYAGEGYPSIFRFCIGRLRLSEEEAFYRIAAARVAGRFPAVLEWLRAGRVTLTAVALLRKHLPAENHACLLEAAEGRNKREVQALVAALAPQPDVAPSIRRLPAPRAAALGRPAGDRPVTTALDLAGDRPGAPATRAPVLVEGVAVPPPHAAADAPLLAGSDAAIPAPPIRCVPVTPPRPAEIRPLAPTRYSLRLTISEETHAKLRLAHDLLGHTVAADDSAAVIDRALTLLVAQLQRAKFAARQALTEPKPQRERGLRPGARGPRPTTAVAPASESPVVARASETGTVAVASEAASPSARGGAVTGGRSAPPSTGRDLARRSRHPPAAVRREVWLRDGGRCRYVAPDGQRCGETRGLEFHHKVPFADGGGSTASNLEVRCTSHNAWDARRWFGDEVTTYRGGSNPGGGPMRTTRAGPS